jgi:hypothetical protein
MTHLGDLPSRLGAANESLSLLHLQQCSLGRVVGTNFERKTPPHSAERKAPGFLKSFRAGLVSFHHAEPF